MSDECTTSSARERRYRRGPESTPSTRCDRAPREIKTVLGMKHMEDKKASVTLLGHELVLQDQVEKMSPWLSNGPKTTSRMPSRIYRTHPLSGPASLLSSHS